MGYIGAQITALDYVLNSFFGIDTLIGIYISAGVAIVGLLAVIVGLGGVWMAS